MPALAELQNRFRDALLSGSDGGLKDSVVTSEVSSQARLDVYRNNVFSSLIEALGALYPVIKRLVGEDFFSATAREFCLAYPPSHGRLSDYGSEFPEFLRAFEPAQSLSYLGDVAALELAWHRAYHATDASSISGSAFEAVAPADLPTVRLQLHPSCSLLASSFPVARIWQLNQPDYESSETIDLGSGGDKLLVIRPDSDVEIRKLGEGSFAFLEALDQGAAVVQAFEAAESAETGFDLQENLYDFLAGGTFSAMETGVRDK